MSCLNNKTILSVCLPLLAVMIATPLQASELGNGDTLPPDVFMNVGGTLEASINGMVTTPTFMTSYTEWVYSDPNNVFCANCLDFVYQFTNNGPGINERFTSFSFEGFRVDAGYEAGSGMNIPLSVDRSTSGAVVGFNYTGIDNLLAGQSTAKLVIESNSMGFTNGFVTVQDGTAGDGPGYAPTAVPEPASLSLLGAGLVIAGRMLMKRIS